MNQKSYTYFETIPEGGHVPEDVYQIAARTMGRICLDTTVARFLG